MLRREEPFMSLKIIPFRPKGVPTALLHLGSISRRSFLIFLKIVPSFVVTDIANYYDSMSYTHLRNVISTMTGAEECVLDMLIYVLSALLWQPDYMPRVEVGLPQINMDAPRLLAHCFLYELDAFLASDPTRDFVRYMDDIDIGVDSVAAAKEVLKSVDLVLQTKQVRLNSGKTLILSQSDALRHFKVVDNARLDDLRDRIDAKRKAGQNLNQERREVEARIRHGMAHRDFDDGNGEKILKRLLNAGASIGARIGPDVLLRTFLLRPAVRENVCAYIRRSDLTVARSRLLAVAAESGHLVDDAAIVDLANHLVETTVTRTGEIQANIHRIIDACRVDNYFHLYCKLWLQSKYDEPNALLNTVRTTLDLWSPHERLGRLIGSFSPLFRNTLDQVEYSELLPRSRNDGALDTHAFHNRLASDLEAFTSMFDALRNPNPSRGTGITHAKFLCLLSALNNSAAPIRRKLTIRSNNSAAWRDVYYRRIARRLGV